MNIRRTSLPSLTATLLLFVVLYSSLFVLKAEADVLHYKDREGKEHFVSDASKVPEEYRPQLNGAAPLPALSKVKPGREKLYEKDHYEVTGAKSVKNGSVAKAKVEIFVTTWCPYCRQLEQFLASENIAYTSYDVEKDEAGKAFHKTVGMTGVPFTRFSSGKVIQGFSPEAIKAELKLQ